MYKVSYHYPPLPCTTLPPVHYMKPIERKKKQPDPTACWSCARLISWKADNPWTDYIIKHPNYDLRENVIERSHYPFKQHLDWANPREGEGGIILPPQREVFNDNLREFVRKTVSSSPISYA